MNSNTDERTIKVCCATFYQSDIVRMLLGDILHPGGLALTGHLGEVMGLSATKHVLDVACGRGTSVVHLAENFGCHVTGLDFGQDNVTSARDHATSRNISSLTDFRRGDAEELPFESCTFDAVISECSFCTFPDKKTAAAEMARVLSSGGRVGLTDMTVNGHLPDDIQSLLSWIACITGAGTPELYIDTLKEAGFIDFTVEDHGAALLEMVNDIRRKLLVVELAASLGKLDTGSIDLGEGKRLARRAVELIETGVLSYTLIVARKA